MKYVKCVENKGYEKYLKVGGIYKVAAETECYYYLMRIGDGISFPRHIFILILPPVVAVEAINDNSIEILNMAA